MAAAAPTAFAVTATPLTPGVPVNINFPANGSVLTNLYIDIDASAQQLIVTSSGNTGDIDLFLRYGSPFPECSDTSACSYEMFLRYAQYHSIGATSNESIVVTNASTIPLAAGRWYITALNSGSSVTASLMATPSATVQTRAIQIDFGNPNPNTNDPTLSCDVAPWSDSTPATPVGNNPGTTLGQQRQNALKEAVNQLSQQLASPVPIIVHACWAHLGGDANRATLAQASSTGVALTDTGFPMPWLAKRYTWYTDTQISRMGGTNLCGVFGGDCGGINNDAIEITFNSDIGLSSVLGGSPFYFGYTPDAGSNSSDFIAIAMHEIIHGLGFSGLANVDPSAGSIGARAGIDLSTNTVAYQNYDAGPWDDIFGDSIVAVAKDQQHYAPFYGYELNDQPNDAARAAAMTSGNTVTATTLGDRYAPTLLRWSDPLAVNSSANQATGNAPANFPSLYAPCDLTKTTTCSTSLGSTLSHTVQQGDLMNAFYNVGQARTMGLAAPMLKAMGWSTTPAPAAVFAKPFTGNWYDRAYSGHGLDLLFVGSNEFGDGYFLIFYTYDATGALEIFQAQGNVVDGVFIPDIIGPDGSTLVRMHYDPVAKKATPTADTGGRIVIDFNQAENSPACRSTYDRSGAPLLGVMSWSFADKNNNITESGDWCIQPVTTLAQNASPNRGGHYYGGPNDSGWGISVLDIDRGSNGAGDQFVVDFFFGDANGKPTWAVSDAYPFVNGQPMDLLQNAAGYCRTCPRKPQDVVKIGTMTLNFGTPNTVSFNVNLPGGGSFVRNNIPIYNIAVAQQP
jgi:hypothetical protein